MFFKFQVSFLKCTIIQLKGGRLQGRASLNLTSERLEPHEESFFLILNLMSRKALLSGKRMTIFLWSISSYLPLEFVFISIINPLTIKSWPGICVYIYIDIYMCVSIYLYIYTHTHTYLLACSGFKNNSSEINTYFLKHISTYIWGHYWSLKKAKP